MRRLDPKILFDSEHLSHDLAGKSVRGGVTAMGSQGVQFILRIASTAVLARLLTPADYGLVGMVLVVTGFAEMFKDAGLSMATLQKEDISHEQISTLFWINVLITVVLGLCVFAGSPLMAWIYGKPELAAITAWLSLSLLHSGLTIQHRALLQRHLRFGALVSINIASQLVTIAVTILLAWLGWRYWALVAGSLTQALVGSLLTFAFCPWIPGRIQKGTGVRGMLKFGGHLTGFSLVNYLSRNADNVLIGRFIGAGALGLYSRAYSLFMLPISQIRVSLDQVAMPVLSSLRNDPDRYVKYYQRLLDILASLTIPLTVYCAFEADFLIRILLGPQWLDAVPVFRLLAIAGLIQPLFSTAGLVQISHGFSRRFLYWGLVGALVYVSSFVIGIFAGIRGVALAYAIANYLMFLPTLLYCFHGTPVRVGVCLRTLSVPIAITSVAMISAIIASKALPDSGIGTHIVLVGTYATVILCMYAFRRPLRETIGFIRNDVPSQVLGRAL